MAVSILLLMEMVLEYSYHQVRFSMIDVSILLLMEMVLESYQFFRMSLVSAINKYKTVQTVIVDTDNPQPRQYGIAPIVIPPQSKWIGTQIDVPYNKDVQLEIESIFVNCASDATTTLGIFDLYSDEQVHTETIKLNKGLN